MATSPSASKFKYAADVGVPSFKEIEAFCRESNIGFSVSSTTGGNHVSGSFHYKGNAEDLTSSPGNMQKLAQWLYGFSPYILELIHSGGSGYFVKYGVKVPAAYYGAATVSQHYNHVHIAMTLSGINAARGQAGSQNGTVQLADNQTGFVNSKTGCAFPAAMMLVAAGMDFSFLHILTGVFGV